MTSSVQAVFFDLFGTLLSLAPLDDACERIAPGRGAELAARWRARQLEASWLRTAMDRWADFDIVTHDALLSTLDELGIAAPADVGRLADAFTELPLAGGAADAVSALREAGIATGILTNASSATLARVVPRLGVPIDHALSVDAARAFKPDPRVYGLAVEATGLAAGDIGFVTANGWDAAGAGAFGFRVAWLRPNPSAIMPAVGAPEPVVTDWTGVPTVFTGSGGQSSRV